MAPPRHAVLLCNPRSGGGKVARFGIVELATELGVETVMLEPGDDLEQLARDAVARGADCLGMAGGDGSQAVVASVAIANGLPFVCVSAGTRNHFALDLGLDHQDPRESMNAFRDATERRIDYASVNDRVFVNNVSLGVYAELVRQDSYRDDRVGTAAKMVLSDLVNHRAHPFDLQFATARGEKIDGAFVLLVSNNPYVLGPPPDIGRRDALDTGRLGVFAVTARTAVEAARLLDAPRLDSPSWHEFTTSTFDVGSHDETAPAGVDGEAIDLTTPLQFRTHPGGLTMLVTRRSLGATGRRRADPRPRL